MSIFEIAVSISLTILTFAAMGVLISEIKGLFKKVSK